MIVFVSNYYNHHQAPFSEAMNCLTNHEYCFIECMPMEEERKNMGWEMKETPVFVKKFYEGKETACECQKLINEAEVVVIGSAPLTLVKKRLRRGKLTFRYSERIFKSGCKKYELPFRIVKYFWQWGRFKEFYLLCASAYAAADYSKVHSFRDKAYKWGYFPKTETYSNLERVVNSKKNTSILWVGRLVQWKHPDASIEVAKKLKNDGYSFHLNVIGNGVLEEEIKKKVWDEGLNDYVTVLGALPPEQVRSYMEEAGIFLFTSDFNEGWGAVLNESMNSGCAVVASHAIGSVPFLIQDGFNGLIYENGNQEDLYKKIKFLLDNPEKQKHLGREAYKTVLEKWNAKIAAERLIELAKVLLDNESNGHYLYSDGPCSKAEIIENGWLSKGC